MYPKTVIGAAAPVIMTGEGPHELGEKHVSAFREKFAAVAEDNGYPRNLAIAMVDANHDDIYEINIEGKKMFLKQSEIEEYEKKGKKFDVPENPIIPKGKLLTVSAQEASERYGIAKIIDDRRTIYKDYGFESPFEVEEKMTWAEKLVEIVTSPLVSLILLTIIIASIWITLKTGFGTVTVIGLGALAFLLFGHYLAGLADIPKIAIFFLGFILLMVEIFVLPGFGVAGILGILLIIVGLVLSLQRFTIPDITGAPWELDAMLSAVGRVLFGLVAGSILFFIVVRYLRHAPVLGRMVLATELTTDKGYVADIEEASGLVGKRGIVISPLRPSGKVEIGENTIDVVAEGDFIEKGEEVEVVYIEGTKIVVDRIKKV
jgi:membrane-bound serine protease (ClpP class)